MIWKNNNEKMTSAASKKLSKRELHEFAVEVITAWLDLKVAGDDEQKDYDATDQEGRTYRVKTRTVESLEDYTSFDFPKRPQNFDYLIGVLFTHHIEPLRVLKIPHEVYQEYRSINEDSYRFRISIKKLQKYIEETDVKILYKKGD